MAMKSTGALVSPSSSQNKNTGRIYHTTQEASLEQVSSPGGVYISPWGIAYSTLGAEGGQMVYPSSRGEVYTPPGPETCSEEASQVVYCILPVFNQTAAC